MSLEISIIGVIREFGGYVEGIMAGGEVGGG